MGERRFCRGMTLGDLVVTNEGYYGVLIDTAGRGWWTVMLSDGLTMDIREALLKQLPLKPGSDVPASFVELAGMAHPPRTASSRRRLR